MRDNRSIVRTVAAAVAVSGVVSSVSAEMSFTPLGDLPGGQFLSAASATSANGSVVVGWSASALGNEAFRWTQSVGMVPLGDLGTSTPFSSIGNATSADGSVVVGSGRDPAGGTIAARWTAETGFQSLGQIPGAPAGTSVARGVSADGTVAVGIATGASGHSEAFRWTAATGMQSLSSFPGSLGSVPFSEADAISSDGTTVVGRVDGVNEAEAFRWTASMGMQLMGDLPGAEFHSEALGVSRDGGVLVGFGRMFSSGGISTEIAYRWTASSGMVPLGDLPGGIERSWATSVSDDGSVVVGFSNTFDGNSVFIWDQVHGMRELRGLLGSAGIDMTGWRLTGGSISRDGSTVCGVGIDPSGRTEGWLAVIPTPGSIGLAVFLIPFSLRRRRI